MVWYTGQSLLLILLSFLLGLLVGYLWWGLRLRRVRSSESTSQSTIAESPAPADPPVAAPVAEPEPVAALEAEPVAEPEPLAEPEAEPEPVADPEPEAEPVAELEAEPVVVSEPEPDVTPVAVVEAEPEPETAPESEAEPVAVDAALVAEVESAFEAAEEPAPVDDLARIEGIGPKIAAALQAAGITTYAQLADADRGTIEAALENASLRFAPSLGTWSRQARLLADGDEAGFKELTDRLIAGREVTAKPAPDPAPIEEPVTEPEPVVEEPVAAEPEPQPEPEPVAEETAAVEPEPEPVAEEPEPVAEEPEPVKVPAQAVADDGPVDDLKRIEGIGPKMSGALVAAGIRTYAQLADADVDTLRAAIEAAGLRFAPSIVTWARQARHLADGDEEGFADLTRRLVAGRDIGRA
ncbi:helix-hairpin-helix domain-containing protein [Dactylosporangium sp. CA-139066]|uniref:helix-hairpin-helix domain-containing protein n=1 Tax=Dactylosporangium sp. CA-139066 TaxID=3239930 RepID=UPI003D94E455